MSKFKVNQFKGMDVEVDRTVLGDVKSPDASNVRLENPVGAINNDIGLEKYNTVEYDGSILAIHQLRKHGLVDIDKTMFVLQSGTWSYEVPVYDFWEISSMSVSYVNDYWYDLQSDFFYITMENTSTHYDYVLKTKFDGTEQTILGGASGSGIGQFYKPAGIHYDPLTELIYVSDQSGDRLVISKIDGSDWSTVSIGYGGSTSIWYDSSSEYVYLTHPGYRLISRMRTDGSDLDYFETYGGNGEFQFQNRSLRYESSTGYFYFTDGFGNRICRMLWGQSPNDMEYIGLEKPYSGTGTFEFNDPYIHDLDEDGFLYIGDSRNRRVVKCKWDESYWKEYGEYGVGAEEGTFRSSRRSFFDSKTGTVYVLDSAKGFIKFTDNRFHSYVP